MEKEFYESINYHLTSEELTTISGGYVYDGCYPWPVNVKASRHTQPEQSALVGHWVCVQ